MVVLNQNMKVQKYTIRRQLFDAAKDYDIGKLSYRAKMVLELVYYIHLDRVHAMLDSHVV